MIEYRPFRNSDPPALAEIWRARAQERGLMQPMTAALFEDLVLSKPYFDNQGLIVALEDGLPVGFVHAGFGPNDDYSGLSTQLGVTCMLMVREPARGRGIGSTLLGHSEQYLRSRGAQVLYGGGIHPLDPFYLGLYGGSELPGVLGSDADAQRLYRASGYQEIDHCVILHKELAGFRPTVNRQQMLVRRQTSIRTTVNPRPETWWDACTFGGFDRVQFELLNTQGRQVAQATVWSMEPMGTSWGFRAGGVIRVEVPDDCRRQGYATYLLNEVMRHQQQQGVAVLETQTMAQNTVALAMYARLGFHEVDRGTVFRKQDDLASLPVSIPEQQIPLGTPFRRKPS
ncbi:MAG: GNAT family N-acetyltransferase [Planctomycetaceae bacterium]|nr:GNAT family N-acetyltransferase [Planctomycetaceae bacterium]